MLSSDRNLLDPGSRVFARIKEQSQLVDHLHVVLLTPRITGNAERCIDEHLTITVTNSLHRIFFIPDAYVIARRVIKESEKEGASGSWVVTTQDPFWIGAIGWLTARTTGAALHIQLHTDPFSYAWRKEKWIRHIEYPLALFLLTHADGVRVIARRLWNSVRLLGVSGEKITTLPIPTDVSVLQEAPITVDLHRSYAEYTKIVLAMGRLTEEKNFSLLLRAFARARKTHEDTALVLVGKGPRESELRFLARALGIDSHVKFLPWARDVASYYKTADVYVQPSLYEGWGLAVVEALSCGAPVLMTDVGCAGEVVIDGKTGLVVGVGDEDALADALSWLLSHPEEAKRLGAAGKEAVKKLATPVEALQLYKESWTQALRAKFPMSNS